MSRRYAADTTVPVERTQAEIGTLLAKHGATARASGVDDTTGRATVIFALAGRRIRVEAPLHPTTEATPRGWWGWTEAKKRTWTASNRQQRERATWRGILLLLRAKLEAVEGGYSTVDREFLADVLLPGGRSVGQMVSAVVETAYRTGVPPGLLPEAAP